MVFWGRKELYPQTHVLSIPCQAQLFRSPRGLALPGCSSNLASTVQHLQHTKVLNGNQQQETLER